MSGKNLKITGILAATSSDSLGTSLSKESLRSLQKQIDSRPELQYLSSKHDISKPPVGKIISTKIVKIKDDQEGVLAEIEVFDKNAIEEIKSFVASGKGGFSYAGHDSETYFSGESTLLSLAFDDQLFSKDDVLSFLGTLEKETQKNVTLKPLRERSFGVEALIVILLPAAAVATYSFSKKFGEQLGDLAAEEVKNSYKIVKGNLSRWLKERNLKTKIQLSIRIRPAVDFVFHYNPEQEDEIENALSGDFLDGILTSLKPPVQFDEIVKISYVWKNGWAPIYLIAKNGCYEYQNHHWVKISG